MDGKQRVIELRSMQLNIEARSGSATISSLEKHMAHHEGRMRVSGKSFSEISRKLHELSTQPLSLRVRLSQALVLQKKLKQAANGIRQHSEKRAHFEARLMAQKRLQSFNIKRRDVAERVLRLRQSKLKCRIENLELEKYSLAGAAMQQKCRKQLAQVFNGSSVEGSALSLPHVPDLSIGTQIAEPKQELPGVRASLGELLPPERRNNNSLSVRYATASGHVFNVAVQECGKGLFVTVIPEAQARQRAVLLRRTDLVRLLEQHGFTVRKLRVGSTGEDETED